VKASRSSSPRAQAKGKSEAPKKVKAASLDDVFGDPAIKDAYLSKWADKEIANGRQVELVDIASRGPNLKPHFDALGWTPILSVKELQYARLTRAFYATADESIISIFYIIFILVLFRFKFILFYYYFLLSYLMN